MQPPSVMLLTEDVLKTRFKQNSEYRTPEGVIGRKRLLLIWDQHLYTRNHCNTYRDQFHSYYLPLFVDTKVHLTKQSLHLSHPSKQPSGV